MNRKRVNPRGEKGGRPGFGGKEKTEEERNQEKIVKALAEKERILSNWTPKTVLGKKVKAGDINSLDEIFNKGQKILEPQIVDSLAKFEEVTIDVAKTTHVVRAGRKFSYRATVLIGNRAGYIGIGTGKAVERFPAIGKAVNDAKLNLKRIYLGAGSWEEQPTTEKHSIPFKVKGKCGGVQLVLWPAPKGTGLVVGKNVRVVLELAGVKDVWSKATGSSDTRLNFVRAGLDALEQTGKMKASKDIEEKMTK